MGTQKANKLNWLQRNVPDGLLVDASWLEKQGFSTALRSKYLRHGWLEQPARAVYRRPRAWLGAPAEGKGVRWQNVVISLQMLLGYRIAVGGRSALEEQGFAHYLAPSGAREVHVCGDEHLPGWARKLKIDAKLIFHNSTALFKKGMPPGGFPAMADSELARCGLVRHSSGFQEWPMVMSSPERAVLELLEEVPQRETFHQADVLMEGLRNLSPRRLQRLLADCRSIKVKRLLLWFAERHGHAWLGNMDREAIDLGRGKRMLARGGRLDTRYNITVPKDLDARA